MSPRYIQHPQNCHCPKCDHGKKVCSFCRTCHRSVLAEIELLDRLKLTDRGKYARRPDLYCYAHWDRTSTLVPVFKLTLCRSCFTGLPLDVDAELARPLVEAAATLKGFGLRALKPLVEGQLPGGDRYVAYQPPLGD